MAQDEKKSALVLDEGEKVRQIEGRTSIGEDEFYP